MNKQWGLIVLDDEEKLAERTAEQVRAELRARPRAVLALPTGKTPLAMYARLVAMGRRVEVDFSQATAFNLDEFYGLPSENPSSFGSYLKVHFLDLVNMGTISLLDGTALYPQRECTRLEASIASAGGLDLAILGIGCNGHIAFNEPGSSRNSRTRLVSLTESSRRANQSFFPPEAEVPHFALTMGIATILEARSIVLLASGHQKAEILARALQGPITEEVPASYLQQHPNLTVIADRAASSKLTKGQKAKRERGERESNDEGDWVTPA